MISLCFIVLCLYLAYRVWSEVGSQVNIYKEYHQRSLIRLLIWFVPIGAIVTVFLPSVTGWFIPYVLSSIFYLAVILETRSRISKLETSGTNRTAKSIKTLQLATLSAIVGFIYIGVELVLISLVVGLKY